MKILKSPETWPEPSMSLLSTLRQKHSTACHCNGPRVFLVDFDRVHWPFLANPDPLFDLRSLLACPGFIIFLGEKYQSLSPRRRSHGPIIGGKNSRVGCSRFTDRVLTGAANSTVPLLGPESRKKVANVNYSFWRSEMTLSRKVVEGAGLA